jgi:hypothetical protein
MSWTLSPPASSLPDVGSQVIARLLDGRLIKGKVTAVVGPIGGRRIHIASGPFTTKVDDIQILRTLSAPR